MAAVRTVTVSKSSPGDRFGVRLADNKGKSVKVVEVDPKGLLFGLIAKGESIISINGIPCTSGHIAAAEALKEASLEVATLEVVKRSRMLNRWRAATTAITVVTPPPAAAAPDPPEILNEPVSSASSADPTTYQQLADAPPTLQPALEQSPASAQPEPALAASSQQDGDYTVVLLRKGSNSIGMRLVQKRHTDLPYVADIDPYGPAGDSSIRKGDFILEVNGVDARATHDELKRALGQSGSEAVIKLRRGLPTPREPYPPTEERYPELAGTAEFKAQMARSEASRSCFLNLCAPPERPR